MPKVLEIEQLSELSPEELQSALQASTRFSLTPFRGSPLVGNKRLKGTVKGTEVKVGLTKRDWLTLMQPVFEGHIEARPSGGSRLVGSAGMPTYIVWTMRLVTALVVPSAIVAATWPVLSQLGDQGMVLAALLGLVMALGAVFGVGVHVSHAEQQLPMLEATLADIAGSPAPLDDPQGAAIHDPEPAPQQAHRAQASATTREH